MLKLKQVCIVPNIISQFKAQRLELSAKRRRNLWDTKRSKAEKSKRNVQFKVYEAHLTLDKTKEVSCGYLKALAFVIVGEVQDTISQ